jgi:hypothetical protein
VSIGKEFNMRRTLFILSIVILSGFVGTRALGQSRNSNVQLALVGGTIYASPTEEPIRNGVILIDGDKIVAVGRRASVRVPRGINIIDCTGLTITAGFWNSHVHFLAEKRPFQGHPGSRGRPVHDSGRKSYLSLIAMIEMNKYSLKL